MSINYYMGIDAGFNKDLSAIAIGHLEENKIKIDYLKSKRTKSIKELTKWKADNQHKFDDNDKISILFNKAGIKLMNISFWAKCNML